MSHQLSDYGIKDWECECLEVLYSRKAKLILEGETCFETHKAKFRLIKLAKQIYNITILHSEIKVRCRKGNHKEELGYNNTVLVSVP